MRVFVPAIDFAGSSRIQPAHRPETLSGLRIGFLDGWGHNDNGTLTMYPLMKALLSLIRQRYDIASYEWKKKPSISEPLDAPALREFTDRVDVVINGEAA